MGHNIVILKNSVDLVKFCSEVKFPTNEYFPKVGMLLGGQSYLGPKEDTIYFMAPNRVLTSMFAPSLGTLLL